MPTGRNEEAQAGRLRNRRCAVRGSSAGGPFLGCYASFHARPVKAAVRSTGPTTGFSYTISTKIIEGVCLYIAIVVIKKQCCCSYSSILNVAAVAAGRQRRFER